jgi:opacity protein-like surface antigen
LAIELQYSALMSAFNSTWLISVLGILILTAPAQAQTSVSESGPSAESDRHTLHEHRVQLGLNLYEFNYKEQISAPRKSTETGLVPGLRVEYAYTPHDTPVLAGVTVAYSPGSTGFDGTTQKGDPVIASTANQFITIEGSAGYAVSSFFHPYAGIGFRYWQRGDGAANEQGIVSYREDYSWFYLPVGLRLQTDVTSRLNVALDAAALFMFAGHISVHLSDVDPTFNDPDADLGSKTGYRVRLPATYRISGGLGVTLAPWYEYSAIGRSGVFALTQNGSIVGTGVEPDSRTHQYGGSLEVALLF